jgi:hypothetical protein
MSYFLVTDSQGRRNNCPGIKNNTIYSKAMTTKRV